MAKTYCIKKQLREKNIRIILIFTVFLLSKCLPEIPFIPDNFLADYRAKKKIIHHLKSILPGITLQNILRTKVSGISNEGKWKEVWYNSAFGSNRNSYNY